VVEDLYDPPPPCVGIPLLADDVHHPVLVLEVGVVIS